MSEIRYHPMLTVFKMFFWTQICITVYMCSLFICYTKTGRSALMVACLQNKTKAVQLLLDAGADISMNDNQGKTVLHFAVSESNIDLIQQLILRGVKIDIKDNCGRTPLIQSCMKGNHQTTEALLQSGANVQFADAV